MKHLSVDSVKHACNSTNNRPSHSYTILASSSRSDGRHDLICRRASLSTAAQRFLLTKLYPSTKIFKSEKTEKFVQSTIYKYEGASRFIFPLLQRRPPRSKQKGLHIFIRTESQQAYFYAKRKSTSAFSFGKKVNKRIFIRKESQRAISCDLLLPSGKKA